MKFLSYLKSFITQNECWMNKKKKLLILHPELVVGGVERALLEMLRELDREKFEITLLLRNKACWDNQIPQYIDVHYMMQKNPYQKGRIISRLYKYVMLAFPGLVFCLCGVRGKFDVVIAYHEPMIWYLPCIKAYRISWVHSDYSVRQYPPEVKSLGNKTGRLAKWIIKRRVNLIRSLDKVVFVAKTCIPSYVEKNRFNESKVVVCYNINNEKEILNMAQEPITDTCWNNYNGHHIVIVGRIHHEKAMYRLIPLMRHLKNMGIEAKIYIVGDGSERRQMEILISQANLEDGFEIMGYRSNPYKYINRAKLLLCCSPSEAYCTTTKESILLETPFVTTLCSGMEEQIGGTKAGLIAPNGDDTLAPYVIRTLSDEVLYAEMKCDIHQRHLDLSDQRSVEMIESLLINCGR